MSSTRAPEDTCVSAGAIEIKWVAPTALVSAPEDCDERGVAHSSDSLRSTCARTRWRSPAGFLIGTASLPGRTGTVAGSPCIARRAGRTKSSNVTIAEMGFPGSPNTSVGPFVPTASGLPGFIATFQKSIATPSD